MDFYSSGQPLFLDAQAAAAKDTAINEVKESVFIKFVLVWLRNMLELRFSELMDMSYVWSWNIVAECDSLTVRLFPID